MDIRGQPLRQGPAPRPVIADDVPYQREKLFLFCLIVDFFEKGKLEFFYLNRIANDRIVNRIINEYTLVP
jgi:hypothetical protein